MSDLTQVVIGETVTYVSESGDPELAEVTAVNDTSAHEWVTVVRRRDGVAVGYTQCVPSEGHAREGEAFYRRANVAAPAAEPVAAPSREVAPADE